MPRETEKKISWDYFSEIFVKYFSRAIWKSGGSGDIWTTELDAEHFYEELLMGDHQVFGKRGVAILGNLFIEQDEYYERIVALNEKKF
ncbi:Oidioi.mRNA.OKI2018_I69.chr2.g5408.t1.cds [Oikopleura dioica]|uniref:Oidioi.mRNA.OKI2018_I69.chr2.g5408.t1.cds n=1 Tax=Oikopleura dioica TaxID=34765 RepID=A0ABN7T6V9_OIKDI|nr:Oidioi.mRNA.OKI2018_I69.chr2.g5408.t1.cds [Oikopleura dioica]